MLKHWPIRVLFLLFLAPFCAAILVLKFGDYNKFAKVANGSILTPPQPINLPAINNIWQIVYVNPVPCNTECIAKKTTLNNLHIALGADQSRVKITNIENTVDNTAYEKDSVLIVDPNNLAIMYYAPQENMRGLLKDIKRLLKYSHV